MKPLLLSILASFLLLSVCVSAQQGPAFKQENTPENLKSLFQTLHTAIHANDTKTAVELTRSLFPTADRLKGAFREDVDKAFLDNLLKDYQNFLSAPDEKLAKALSADKANSEVQVHGAKTEDIILNKQGTIVFQEFPGGAVKLAQKTLKPGVTFYEVELVKPGESSGMKFHLFFWDGTAWAMIGPAWRGFK